MCKGTAKQEKGNIFPQTECTINYEDHSYVKYKMASNKISKNDLVKMILKKKYINKHILSICIIIFQNYHMMISV